MTRIRVTRSLMQRLAGLAFSLLLCLSTGLVLPLPAFAEPEDEGIEVEFAEELEGEPQEEPQPAIPDEFLPRQVSIYDLVDADASLNGTTVTFTGEAVGTPVVADDSHTWVTLSDNGSSIAVYMRNDRASTIQHYGEYGEVGDMVTVVGNFYFDCTAHQGDIDVHATSMQVVGDGYASLQEPDVVKTRLAVILVVVGAITGVVYFKLRDRMR